MRIWSLIVAFFSLFTTMAGAQDMDLISYRTGLSRECSVNAQGGLNLRRAPSTTSEIVSVLPNGEIVTILGIQDNPMEISGYSGYWLQIRRQSSTEERGWVFSSFLSPLNGETIESSDIFGNWISERDHEFFCFGNSTFSKGYEMAEEGTWDYDPEQNIIWVYIDYTAHDPGGEPSFSQHFEYSYSIKILQFHQNRMEIQIIKEAEYPPVWLRRMDEE